ncbi:MAG: peptide/nickel transport system substrate-binding protein, partial [Gaiellaceae bacterium]|nr:peptide/nickel transport system substrate-binding protein [Gaiellaceae bacterium]
MRYPKEEIEKYRRTAGETENELISEYKDGNMSRRELLQRGSVLGMSLPFLGLLAGGAQAAVARPRAIARRAATTLRFGGVIPDGSLEPPLLQSLGAIGPTHMAGEQLVFADKNSVLRPRLATSWKASKGAKSWTFKIRQGVKFHDGTPLSADDVVATFNRLLTKDSQALSSFKGVLSAGGVHKVDDHTVRFDLDSSNGFFPYLTGQMTYQALILPKSYQLPSDLSKPGEFTTKMNGTGPFMLKDNRGAAGLTFVANPNYWGGKPALDTVEYSILEDQARVTALQSGQIDLAHQISFQGAQQLQGHANVIPLQTANHRYLNMNVTKKPFSDVRVRQAIALALDRPQIASGLWGKYAQVGDDSPMWPGYAFTDKSVPQRKQDLAKARALLKAAGATNLNLTLTCYRSFEMPDYAQRVAQALKKIGINCQVKVFTSAQYFDGVSFGATGKLAPWLGTDFGIVDYGHRAVPLTYLNAALRSKGVWNAARYNNKQFDATINHFQSAASLKDQKKYARQIQQQLLKDTPVIYGFFYNFIAAASPKVHGYVPDGIAVVNLRG